MIFSPVFLLAFAQVQTPSAPDYTPIEVRSTDAACLARIDRAAGQERVAPNMARFTLTVFALSPAGDRRELWHTLYPFDGLPAHYLLANRGHFFARVAERYTDSKAVIRIDANEREPAEWTGAQLLIPHESLGGPVTERTWLDEGRPPMIAWADSAFGPRIELRVPCRGEFVRSIDLDHLALVDPAAQLPQPRVEPLAWNGPPTRFITPFVHTVQVEKTLVHVGEAVEVRIFGNHPTPGHRFLGFHLAPQSDEPTAGRDALHELMLLPRSRPPDGVQAQVLEPFQGIAKIFDLAAGHYRLDVAGWERRGAPEIVFDVMPVGWIVGVHITGGIMGLNQSIDVYEQGVARTTGRDGTVTFVELTPESVQHICALLSVLPSENTSTHTAVAADLFNYTVTFSRGERSGSQSFDDISAEPAQRELVAALRALVAR